MHIRLLSGSDTSALRELAALAEAERFRFVTRLLDDLVAGLVQLDAPGEFFLVAPHGDQLVAVGGITPDPYVPDSRVGRLRHLYVRADRRRTGLGRALVAHLERRAARYYERLRLRTDNPDAAEFYERLGYQPVTSESATHDRALTATSTRQQPDDR
jgi:GNAT superfamily N-acetyltransferase